MAYRLFSLLGLSLCSGYVYCQTASLTLELPSALVVPGWVTEPQLIGTDGGAMTTYGGAVTATVFGPDATTTSVTYTYIVSASGFVFENEAEGVTEACNVVGTTAVNCEISNGTTAYDTMGPISTVVLAVKTQLSQASQTSSSTAPSALSSLSPKPSPTSTAPTSTATTSTAPQPAKNAKEPVTPIIGSVVGVVLLLLIILICCLVRALRRKRQLRQLRNAQLEAISPFSNPPSYNDNSVPSSAIRRSRLSLESGGGRSRSEKRERKRATVCFTEPDENLRGELNRLQNGLADGHADWGMMANLQQRMAEILQRVRRIEEQGVVNDHPPDYAFQHSEAA